MIINVFLADINLFYQLLSVDYKFLTFSNIFTINCKVPLSSRKWCYINYFIIVIYQFIIYAEVKF